MLTSLLRPAALQEALKTQLIVYLLCSAQGAALLKAAAQLPEVQEIYEANSWIKENYKSAFTVGELAQSRNMSVSLFHQKFKSAIGMGPLQCQKRLQLTEARRLMLDDKLNVTQAALEVSYEIV